ncbi:MAG: Gfo/Idh/MocA family oxidoreductase [Bryobacteraceae bacterium]
MTRRKWLTGTLMATARAAPLRLPRKVRVALIGLEGHMSEILDPLPLLPDIEITAMADRDPEMLADMARNPAVARARPYRDYRELLSKERFDIAGIGGTNGERAEIILACAQRKVHVVSEKPLATETAALERVQRAVKENGIHLTMLLPMRFEPPYAAMRKLVEQGYIGEVAQIAAQKSYKLGDRPDWMRHHSMFGGTIPYIGIHMVDLMRFTSGRELLQATAWQSRIGYPEMRDLENTAACLFHLDNGGTAVLHLDYLRPETAPTHGDDRLRLAGTRGVVEFQEASGLTLVTDKTPPRTVHDLPPHRWLFVDFLNGVYNGKSVGLSLIDIYRSNEIVLAARQSAQAGDGLPVCTVKGVAHA